jgi:hypothetical protein
MVIFRGKEVLNVPTYPIASPFCRRLASRYFVDSHQKLQHPRLLLKWALDSKLLLVRRTGYAGSVPSASKKVEGAAPQVPVGSQCEFHCPALAQVRDRYPHLFSSSSWSLRTFIWQQDQVAVVNFVFDAFQARLVFQGR